jgi:hypothetical protein
MRDNDRHFFSRQLQQEDHAGTKASFADASTAYPSKFRHELNDSTASVGFCGELELFGLPSLDT